MAWPTVLRTISVDAMHDAVLHVPEELVERLRTAQRVTALTGAGASAESGIPTFRDAQTGLWSQYRAEDLATPQAFRRNPRLVWEWYAWRRQLVAQAQPNAAHRALAQLEQFVPHFTLITQNVDGLHQRAGSSRVIELHGNLERVRFFDEDRLVEAWNDTAEVPPRCPDCGGLLRPDVVWFGEMLRPDVLEHTYAATVACDLFLSIGTSGLVEPAASLPRLAAQHGALVVVINPEPATMPGAILLRARAGLALPELVRQAWPGAV